MSTLAIVSTLVIVSTVVAVSLLVGLVGERAAVDGGAAREEEKPVEGAVDVRARLVHRA